MFTLPDTETDKNGQELCGGVHTEQTHTPTQITTGFCVYSSVFVSISVSVSVSVSDSVNAP